MKACDGNTSSRKKNQIPVEDMDEDDLDISPKRGETLQDFERKRKRLDDYMISIVDRDESGGCKTSQRVCRATILFDSSPTNSINENRLSFRRLPFSPICRNQTQIELSSIKTPPPPKHFILLKNAQKINNNDATTPPPMNNNKNEKELDEVRNFLTENGLEDENF